MNLKMVDGVKKRITATPLKNRNNTTKTIVNCINICFLKYLNELIDEKEYEILSNMVKNEIIAVKNISEAVRVCINYNTVVLMGGA